MVWDLSRIPYAMAKFSQPDGRMISLVTAAELEASPCEFHLSHQVSLGENASKSSWDFRSDSLVVERMAPVGKHSISFPAILLLASSFWSAMSPPFPLESLPQYIGSKHMQGFQDRLNCSCSQDRGWDSHPTGPFPASMHRDLAPWLPQRENVGAWPGWLRTCNDDGLVTSSINHTGTPHAVLRSCCHTLGLELCCAGLHLRLLYSCVASNTSPSFKLLKIIVEIRLLLLPEASNKGILTDKSPGSLH